KATVFPRWPPAGKMYDATGGSARRHETTDNTDSTDRERPNRTEPVRFIPRFPFLLSVPSVLSVVGSSLEQLLDHAVVVDDLYRPAIRSIELLIRVNTEQVIHGRGQVFRPSWIAGRTFAASVGGANDAAALDPAATQGNREARSPVIASG